MPIGYVFETNRALTIVVWDGVVQQDEWRRHALQMTKDRRFPTHRVLVDCSTATSDLLSIEDASGMVKLYSEALEDDVLPEKCAIVLTPTGFELGEVVQEHFHSAMEVVMFDRLADACRWLGLEFAHVNEEAERVREGVRESDAD